LAIAFLRAGFFAFAAGFFEVLFRAGMRSSLAELRNEAIPEMMPQRGVAGKGASH